jgi:hypothetical protein
MKSFINPSVIGYLVHKSGLFYDMTLPRIVRGTANPLELHPNMIEPIKTSYKTCQDTIAPDSLWVFQDQNMALIHQLHTRKGNAVGGEGVILYEVRTQLTGLEIGFLPEHLQLTNPQRESLKRILQHHDLTDQVDKPLYIKPDNLQSLNPTGNVLRWRPQDGFKSIDLGLKAVVNSSPSAVLKI